MPKRSNINRLTTVCMWTDYIDVFESPSLIWTRRKKAGKTPAARGLTLTLLVHMHKGYTRGAHGTNTPAVPCPQQGGETGRLTGSGGSSCARGDIPCQSAGAAMSRCALRLMVEIGRAAWRER